MKNIAKEEHGFGHIILLLIAAVGILGVLITVFMHRGPIESSKDHGKYELSIEKHSKDSPFVNSYWLKFKWLKYEKASEGDAIAVPELKLIEHSGNSITISVSSHMDKYSNPCAFIEPWNCDKPTLPETAIELPSDFVKLNNNSDLVININRKKTEYKIESQNYYLSLINSNREKVSTIPHYPNGVATAESVYAGNLFNQSSNNRQQIDNQQRMCNQYSTKIITDRLRAHNVELASDKYPGIEAIRTQDVLVLTKVNHVYNGLGDEEATLTPLDENGCKLVLSGT